MLRIRRSWADQRSPLLSVQDLIGMVGLVIKTVCTQLALKWVVHEREGRLPALRCAVGNSSTGQASPRLVRTRAAAIFWTVSEPRSEQKVVGRAVAGRTAPDLFLLRPDSLLGGAL